MDNIKLISIDLDGTLLRNDKTISTLCLESISKLKKDGKIIVFNSARPLKLIPLELLKIFKDDYWVLSNGTCCMHRNKILYENEINTYDIRNIISYFHDNYPNIFYSVESKNDIYSSFNDIEKCNLFFSKYVEKNTLLKKSVKKFLIINYENKYINIKNLQKTISNKSKILITEKGKYIQVMPRDSSKLTGIEFISKQLCIDLKDVLAFGDDINDLEIVKNVGFGVAMGNSDMEVKKISNFITKSNEESGIYHFLLKYKLI